MLSAAPMTHTPYFHPAVDAWFGQTFPAPTPAQADAWPAIQSGKHVLIAAPTGSGKTLAAFLAAIDELVREGEQFGLPDETRIVYVSPLKALSNDINRNLEAPLAGIRDKLLESGQRDVCVGGELVDISRTPGNGQVYDVNSYALAAAGRDAGAEVNRVGIVDTDPKALRDVIEGQINRAEAVVIAGAVGGAAAEGVRTVLAELGEMEVARIAMHPGSGQGFGQLGRDGVPVFLLPANPVSALVVFEVMVRPLIRLSLGKRQAHRRIVQARTLSPIASVAGRKGFLRGQLMRDQDTGEYLVQALGGAPGASSHLLATLAEANCLVIVPSEADEVRTGEVVDVAFLAQRG
jgi:molybdenum cofactor synthesis domain-containing protein